MTSTSKSGDAGRATAPAGGVPAAGEPSSLQKIVKRLEERFADADTEFKVWPATDPEGWCDWQMPIMQGYKMKCCDCGLVHEIEFNVTEWKDEDRVEFRMRRKVMPEQEVGPPITFLTADMAREYPWPSKQELFAKALRDIANERTKVVASYLHPAPATPAPEPATADEVTVPKIWVDTCRQRLQESLDLTRDVLNNALFDQAKEAAPSYKGEKS